MNFSEAMILNSGGIWATMSKGLSRQNSRRPRNWRSKSSARRLRVFSRGRSGFSPLNLRRFTGKKAEDRMNLSVQVPDRLRS